MQAQAGTVDIHLLPKAAQNVLLARGVPPEEKLNRLETMLGHKSAESEGAATPAGRFLPLPMFHTVHDGDCIASIADEFGSFADKIRNHPNNEKLQHLRKDLHVLNPGDSVYIPEREPKEESRPTDAQTPLSIEGRAGQDPYPVSVFRKASAEPGLHHPVSELSFRETGRWVGVPSGVRFAEAGERSGGQDWLAALGYHAGPNSGEFDAGTKQALSTFQAKYQLDPTGEVDDKTRDLLVSMAGA